MMHKISTIFFFLLVSIMSIHARSEKESLQSPLDTMKPEYEKAIALSIASPDSSLALLDYCVDYYAHDKDTARVIEALLLAHDICKTHMWYKAAYDNAWDVLAYAKQSNDSVALYRAYDDIGIMYFIFHNKEEADRYYQKALAYNKALVSDAKVEKESLISSYYNFVMLNNRMGDYKIGKLYLDTCFSIANELGVDAIKKGYLVAEEANIAILEQHYELAEQLLLKTIADFEILSVENITYASHVGYLVMLYSFLGDAYQGLEDRTQAMHYYTKSLNTMRSLKSHKSYEADLLLKIANLHHRNGSHDDAYRLLRRSKAINDRIYSSTNSQNLDLLQIRNKYEDDIQAKNRMIYEQNIEAKDREKKLLYVKTILITSVAVFVVVFLLIVLIYEKKKHLRKEQADQRVIEIKNKELTSFSLQFVEKEKQLAELSQYIKSKMPKDKVGQKLISKSKKNRDLYWEEFNSRFVKVNKNFYKNLSKKYPMLTSTDLKHCALIKLNFSNKEIADLLSISVSSVYMSHHRLRKKLNLDGEVNLSNFIAAF